MHIVGLLLVVAFLSGCGFKSDTICDFPVVAPSDIDDGKGTAQKDGQPFDGEATWAPGGNASVTLGLLDMTVAQDQTGTAFDQLVGDGTLPFCVPLAERSESSGQASFNESPGFVTDAVHTGRIVILGFSGDILSGRFEVELSSPNGGQTLSFTDGEFRARHR